MWAGSGRPVRPFATAELIAVIVLILPLYASALGMLEVDLYRLGYAPLCGGAIALVLGVYAMSRRHYFVAVGVLAGQLAWSFDVTSTNIVDHIGHVVILGAAAVVLLLRLTGLALRAMRGSA
ncbi:MAG: hypothetical protein R3256_01295 [Thalassovita sp.]|nr:hypothetical protein [Thalassovita sp.]